MGLPNLEIPYGIQKHSRYPVGVAPYLVRGRPLWPICLAESRIDPYLVWDSPLCAVIRAGPHILVHRPLQVEAYTEHHSLVRVGFYPEIGRAQV